MSDFTQESFAAPLSSPDGPLGIIALDSIRDIGEKVDAFLSEWHKERVLKGLVSNNQGYARDSYLIECDLPRFGSGEAKGVIKKSGRGLDIYILVDVCNNSMTYRLGEYQNIMSPDDHFQDLKRIIAAISGRAHRITVIMPYLYEGRMQTRSGRESLDCANMLQELERLGVATIITFDAHDPRVENAVPMMGCEIFRSTYQFIKNLLRHVKDIKVDSDHLMVISPDAGGMNRAVYMANVLGVDMGMFYKKRDYSVPEVNGQHPIVATEFLGSDVRGKDMIILDDMISSGGTMLSTAKLLKERGAGRIFLTSTFGIFTNGLEAFDKAYEEGLFDRLITTNLVHQPEEFKEKPYTISCDMSKFIALIIDTLNHDETMSPLLNPQDRVRQVIEKYERGEEI